jgi:hypothetical protein
MTPPGIEPVTFRFVAQYLNHCATMVPPPYLTYLQISQMIWFQLSLPNEKLSISWWVRMCQSLQIISAHYSTSGPTGVTEQPERGRSWGSALPVSQTITLLPSNQWCFCWPLKFLKHHRQQCGHLSPILSRQQEITQKQTFCNVHHWSTPIFKYCCSGTICQKYLQLRT